MEANTPVKLHSRLSAVHQRGQTLNILLGVAHLVKWVLILFITFFAIDWLLHLSSQGRTVLLILILAFAVRKAWQFGWKHLSALNLAHSALKVEKHYKNLNSLLVTGVQLYDQNKSSGKSSSMTEATIKQADEASTSFKAEEVVPFDALKKNLTIPALLFGALVLFGLVNSPMLMAGLARIFTPWEVTFYPTNTKIELENSNLIVKEGERVDIKAMITGEVPEKATIALKTGSGKPYNRKLDVVEGKAAYEVAAAFRSFDFAIYAGDAETTWHTVKVISSPKIEETKLRLVYPEYMNRESENLDTLTLTVPEGTKIEWDLKLDRSVKEASFTVEGSKTVKLTPSEDGFHVKHSVMAESSRAYYYTWVDKANGFTFKSSKHYLQVTPDQAPVVELAQPHKNIFATIGRVLDLKYRARDDHGLGEAKIIYQHNNTPAKEVPFKAKRSTGRQSNSIDWDYRKEIKDINIGESISFAIEISDTYPSKNGPHKVKTESRRVSFLSEEDYLNKISALKERILSQLRSIYRQERQAHEVIKSLDPKSDSFEQTSFLESSRQDIIIERISVLNKSILDIIADLKANNIKDEAEYAGLNQLETRLKEISKTHISDAATSLRELGPEANSGAQDIADTAKIVNTAARELGSLVLQLGINQAMEVFARELHVIAQAQTELRMESIESEGKSPKLAKRQKELSAWLNRLLKELNGPKDYTKSPLTIVRLARLVKDLQEANIEKEMNIAAGDLEKGEMLKATERQRDIISELFHLECNVRVGAEYESLLKSRDFFTSSIYQLNQLSLDNDQMTKQQFKANRDDIEEQIANIYKELRLLIVPRVPAPQATLLDEVPSQKPEVRKLIDATQDSLKKSILALQSSQRDESYSAQHKSEETFHKLNKIIRRRLEDRTKTARYGSYSTASLEKITKVRELLGSQLRILEKTEDAEADELNGSYLANTQLHLSKEVSKAIRFVERKNKKLDSSSKITEPMMKMMVQSSKAMAKAHMSLKKNELGDAIEHQLLAVESLENAVTWVNHESNGWLGLANFLITTEGAALPAKYMNDIVLEQVSLIEETKNSTKESRKKLVQIQQNLGRASAQVIELLDTAGSSIDFEQAMIFTASDMGLSALKLEAGDVKAAMSAQTNASKSLKDLSDKLSLSAKQYYYFVMVLEFVQELYTDAIVYQNNLLVLREEMEEDEEGSAKPYLKRLNRLFQESKHISEQLFEATGRKDYLNSHNALTKAIQSLKKDDFDMGLEELTATEDALLESLEELRDLVTHVSIIPDVVPSEAPAEYGVMLDMATLLVDLRKLSANIYKGTGEKKEYIEKLNKLKEFSTDLIGLSQNHASIISADKNLALAIASLKKAAAKEAYKHAYAAEVNLRHCVLEYALYYIELPRRAGSRKKKKGKSTKVTMFKLSNKLKAAFDKEWGGVEGDEAKAGRAEWEVLGSRDRAALNENFVRELPLEYREVLKDYYERLTQ